MKKIFMVVVALATGFQLMAQDSTVITETDPPIKKQKKDWSKVTLKNRAADHFMLQFSIDNWAGAPDSIRIKGFSRGFNAYFMFDFPFKTDPRFSVGMGAGVSSNGIYFDKFETDLKAGGNELPFRDVADTNHFKKYKLATTFLEAPVELRFSLNPEDMDHSWKFALGAKIGTMVNAHTKGKNLQNSSGNTINNYTLKENSRRFFNTTRLSGTVRVGYGNITLFGAYAISPLIKEGFGPEIRPYSIGLTLSGL